MIVYVCVFRVYFLILHFIMCCIIVAWWYGPCGIKAHVIGSLSSFSALRL